MAPDNHDLDGAIAAAVIVRDGTVLLIRRRQKEGTLLWALPSGGVEPGETAEQAAERETQEEVGLTVHAQSVLGERIHPATGRRMIYVACTPDEGEPRVVDTDEIDELAWAKKSQLDEYVPHGFYEAVQEYLAAELA